MTRPHDWAAMLQALLRGEDLDARTTAEAMAEIMRGDVAPAHLVGFLVALRAKGESAEEIAGLAASMRSFALPLKIPAGAVDTCGTGGDRAGTFNISTVAALVAAGAGAEVVKHGNRAASGKCGSADLLEAWGVVIDLPPEGVEACVDALGIGFCFAPTFHPAMRHVMPTRRELGVPTVFNYLGPLTNPGGVTHQTIGVADPALAPKMAAVLARLGADHALVFHAEDGLDELTTTAASHIWEVRDGDVRQWRIDPEELGLPRARLSDLAGGDLADNRRVAERVLEGERGPCRDVAVLGAAAALYAADRVGSIAEGLDAAHASIDEGDAASLLDRWVALSRRQAAAQDS